MWTGFGRLAAGASLILAFAAAEQPAWAQAQNSAQAQDNGVGVGVLAGVTRPSLSANNGSYDAKTGTMLGLWVGGNRDGTVGFVGEFNYVFRKSQTSRGELSYPAFQIPAVFHINFGPERRERGMGYAIIGPSFTFNLKQKLNGVEVPEQQKFKGADIGIVAGGGFEIVRIAGEVRGNWGLRSISSEGSVTDIKSRAIELLVKIRFN